MIPLEDDFGDILRKAMIGTSESDRALSQKTGIDAALIAGWTRGRGIADEEQARAIAPALNLDPDCLADSAAKRWFPDAPFAPDVRCHPQRSTVPSNGYVFSLDGGKRAALIDPAGVPEDLLRVLRDGAYQLHYILITHKHEDHCDAVADVAAAFPRAKIVMHPLDVHAIGNLAQTASLVRDGEELPFGEDASIRTLHTPGHTDGSTCYLIRSTLFTGDTLFAGSVGGAYGDASTYDDILNSIGSKLFTLPEETAVMPGHGPPSTIAQERVHNPFFT
jgi:hydroxyacylglutathione hydrolase